MVLYPPYGIICCRSKSMVLHWNISHQKLLFSIGWIKGKKPGMLLDTSIDAIFLYNKVYIYYILFYRPIKPKYFL